VKTSKLFQNEDKLQLHSSNNLQCSYKGIWHTFLPLCYQIPGLLILIIILCPLKLSASEEHHCISWPLLPTHIFVKSVFRRIGETAKRQH